MTSILEKEVTIHMKIATLMQDDDNAAWFI
jgi:hypothetical protein